MDLLPLDLRSRRLLYAFAAIEMIEFETGRRAAPAAQAAPVAQPAPAAPARPAARAKATPSPAPPQARAKAPPKAEPPPVRTRPLPPKASTPPPLPKAEPVQFDAPFEPPYESEPLRPIPPAAPRQAPPRDPDRRPVEQPTQLPPAQPLVAPTPPPRPPVVAARVRNEDSLLSAEEERMRGELTEIAERLRGRDYFGVLGVQKNATDENIREAYFALAKRTHPDRFSAASDAVKRLAEEVFAVISQANEVLGHRDRRNEYLRQQQNKERDRADIEEGERALKAELAFQKGIALLRKKSHGEAADLFEEAVKLYPDEGEYHAYLGWAMWLANPDATNGVEIARNHILRGRKLAPSSDKPYLFLGRLYKAEGKDTVAEKMFQKVIELDPDCVDAIRELRLIDMRRQRSKGLVSRILRR
jgi:DnaJ-domain-containing protein 1